MKRVLISVLSALVLSSYAHALSPTKFNPTEWKRLQKGEVLISEDKGKKRKVIARVLVKRPVQQIWPVLSDPKKMFSGDPRIKKVHVLEEPTPSRDLVSYAMVISPLMPRLEYVTQIDYTKPNNVHFKRISGNLKDFESDCSLQPLDNNQTLATYTMYVDFGMFVPQFVIRQFIKNDMPNMVSRVVQTIYKSSPN